MTARLSIVLLVMTVAGCSREAGPSAQLDAGEPAPKPHPARPVAPQVQTFIGEIQAIDGLHQTVTIAVGSGAVQERKGLGRVEHLHMDRRLLAQIQVGEVVEYKVRATARGHEVLSVERHIHHDPIGMPPELR